MRKKFKDLKFLLNLESQRIFALPVTASIVNRGKHRKQDREACRRAGVRQVGMAASSIIPQSLETLMTMARKTGEYKTPEEHRRRLDSARI